MALMIDRKQLAEAVDKLKFSSHSEWEALLAVVYSVPAVDAVEVVRCKDCKYYEHPEYYGGGTKDVCRTFKRQMQENDYCSYGVRRADNGKAD